MGEHFCPLVPLYTAYILLCGTKNSQVTVDKFTIWRKLLLFFFFFFLQFFFSIEMYLFTTLYLKLI